jgi:alkylation response protein AidB-like acyl-CoA dehydrogenase
MTQPIAADPSSAASEACGALLEAAAALRPVIRDFQDETERGRRIPLPLVEQFRAAGFYRMVAPRVLGGIQADPLTYLRVVELAAEGDGSAGWNLANHGVGQLAVLSLPDEGVHEIFDHGPDVIVAGTLQPGGGRALPVDGGYVVTGRWRFGSGCDESDWMVGSFEIFDGDGPRRGPDGAPAFWRGFFPRADCTVLDTWDVTGMRGTGSHDWSVTELFVPERRTVRAGVPFANQWQRWPGTIFGLPAHGFIGAHQSAVATGIARAGIDALTELAGSKVPRAQTGLLREQAQVQEAVGRAEALLGAAQAYRTAVTADIWETVMAGRPATHEQRARCRIAASYAADSAMQAVDLMYRAGGTTSIEWNHRLARCWRDVHVVGQAITVLPEYYMLGGRLFLGLDPGPRLA